MSKEIELQPFCGGLSKYDLSVPFVRDGLKAACDGRILVIIPVDEPDTPPGEKPFPKIATMFSDYEWQNMSLVIKESQRSTKENIWCDTCDGSGKEGTECSMCNGSGVGNKCYACGHEKSCGGCGGEGYRNTGRRCPDCEGTGKGYDKQRIGEALFAGRYIARIARMLPNPCVEKVGRKNDSMGPCMRFVFDGGYGYLMALSDR